MSEIKQLKRFIYSATVTSGSGSQSFYIDAESREEADERAANNESDGMYADDSEVTDLDALEYEDETTVDDFGDFPLISREQSLIAQLEAAQKELSAANEKLSKAVEFPDSDMAAVSHIAHWYSAKQCEAWVAGVEFSKKQIIKAGFKVEGVMGTKYIVILQRAWCNDSVSGINYHSDLIEFDKRDKVIKHGFELQDSDDFNIGVLTNGVLTSFDWMDRPLAETKDSLARIASGIGIEGNADAE